MKIFTKWKSPKNQIKFFLVLYFVFPFTRDEATSAGEILKQKKQSKTKGTSDYKKISGCLVCQNQALDYFHISLLKALVSEIEGQVPQNQLQFCHK